jgi:hypothetical protein
MKLKDQNDPKGEEATTKSTKRIPQWQTKRKCAPMRKSIREAKDILISDSRRAAFSIACTP